MLRYLKIDDPACEHMSGNADLRRAILIVLCSSALGMGIAGCSIPEPSPPPPQQYLILFNSGNAALTPEGHQTIEYVASYVRTDPRHRVTIVGKTDTVGSQPGNMSLSQRRAQAVRDALVSAGVPAGNVQSTWAGENQLNVPTGNGVAEPTNRTANIVVQ